MFEFGEGAAGSYVSQATQQRVKRTAVVLTALLVAVFVTIPVYVMIAIAVQSPSSAFAGGSVQLFVDSLSFENFRVLLTETSTPRYFFNSIVVTASSTFLSTVIAVAAGYGLTRFDFTGKTLMARAVLFAYMFSPIVLAIPLYVIFYTLGLLNSYFALTLALTAISAPFTIWLMWQYFQTVPIALEESAWVRGASRTRTIWDVVLPVARPGYISAAIFSFAVSWNDFTMARVVMSQDEMYTITVGASLFLDRVSIGWGETMAASLLIAIPPFCIALFLQNYLLQGFNVGGLE
ncbi:carbohydrate ABC transporter permease [Halobacterium bonnevillei]|jgi:multiple sugar transport system permease protein|uniref:ABC transporter permease subunit n=1 Tax=Halobacterium bonnevillei TaxID=2692200 RepID=A0A6B0SH76_9EURY|nr:carbohydrate ABC transporter permease [Halobacterium bonnevillei]MXR19906.1 ABC transporter permease subunit [Halobacterium bonnevillei]